MTDYAARRAKVAEKLREEGLGACLFQDAEGRRDPTIRYLSGQPGDALLVVSAAGPAVLVAWDVNMAASMASVEEILPYTDFKRLPTAALAAVLPRLGVAKGSRVEIPTNTSYPAYVDFVEALEDYDLVCRSKGIGDFALSLRAVKDAAELGIYRRAARITDELCAEIEAAVRSGTLATELDVALFLERESRVRGCEGMGFETLAAGPARSFGIHAFPPFGAGPFAGRGLSILDCGVNLEGYTTDITMSFVRGPLDAKAERMVALVEEAYAACVAMCAPGVGTLEIARRADAIFHAAGFSMPHALGHGIGLEAHETPAVRNREDNDAVLAPGHIITIEPGLYDPELGGVRLENDVLITTNGHEVITHARTVRL
jgi:Xaa-Pro dipeptidase